MRTPLLVAHCVRRIRGLQNIVPLQRARRCGLRVAFVASECRRLSLLCSAHAAVGCALLCRIRMRGMSLLCIAYSTNITNTTKVPSRGSHGSSNAYAAVGCALRSSHSRASKYRVRRCWLRIAFVASAGFKISSLCSAHAAVGCVLPSSHPNAEDFRYMKGILLLEKPAVPLDPTMPGGWVQLPIHVEGVLHFQHELGMEFRHRGWCRMAHKTLMATAKLNPLTEHIHAFLCF